MNNLVRNVGKGKDGRRGFTLIEVVMATMILAMSGATIASIQYTSYASASIAINRVEENLLIRSILSSLMVFKPENGEYSGTLEDVLSGLGVPLPPHKIDSEVQIRVNVGDYRPSTVPIDLLRKITIVIKNDYAETQFDYYVIKE